MGNSAVHRALAGAPVDDQPRAGPTPPGSRSKPPGVPSTGQNRVRVSPGRTARFVIRSRIEPGDITMASGWARRQANGPMVLTNVSDPRAASSRPSR